MKRYLAFFTLVICIRANAFYGTWTQENTASLKSYSNVMNRVDQPIVNRPAPESPFWNNSNNIKDTSFADKPKVAQAGELPASECKDALASNRLGKDSNPFSIFTNSSPTEVQGI